MADLNKPETSSEALQTTAPPNVNSAVTTGAPPADETPSTPFHANALVLVLRWYAGLAVVLVTGWGISAFFFWLFHSLGYTFREMGVPLIFASGLSLIFFLAVEYKKLLSEFMGLRPFSEDPYGVKGAVYMWALGVPGLLFRSTRPPEEAVDAAGAHTQPQQADGFREIIETIVFVVVLVLLLKSFAAEAFVIPTGSMAETLYGYQRLVKCPECGREFPVNCSNEVDPQSGPATRVLGCTCPGCRKQLHFPAPEKGDPARPNSEWIRWNDFVSRRPDSVETPDPGWNSGDRVLVAKFLYELFNKQPDRLDVVVFKYPGDSRGGNPFPASGPMKNHTPMNYIKRLIGRPGETIAIHRGKLHVLPPGSGVEFDDWKEAQTETEKRITLWQHRYMHSNDEDMKKARELFDQGEKFNIVRKSPDAMLSMRRLVYDNDHQAKDLKGVLPPRWSGEGWNVDGNGFKTAADGDQWLRYHHLLRTTNKNYDPKDGKPAVRSLITDFMGYNFYEPHAGSEPGENWVGDLMVECEVAVDKAQGEVILELSKSYDRFRMHWDLATGNVDLVRVTKRKNETKEEKLGSKKATQPKAGSKYRLRFANFDDRLTVWIDSSMPFDDGVTYKGLREPSPGPVAENDLEPASIGVKGAAVSVRQIRLYRDTYYTVGSDASPSGSDAGQVDMSNPDDWARLHDRMPIRFMYVQPDHYLCLGDNSPESSDGRSWGMVPERLLLGRAVLVYYPFGRLGRIR